MWRYLWRSGLDDDDGHFPLGYCWCLARLQMNHSSIIASAVTMHGDWLELRLIYLYTPNPHSLCECFWPILTPWGFALWVEINDPGHTSCQHFYPAQSRASRCVCLHLVRCIYSWNQDTSKFSTQLAVWLLLSDASSRRTLIIFRVSLGHKLPSAMYSSARPCRMSSIYSPGVVKMYFKIGTAMTKKYNTVQECENMKAFSAIVSHSFLYLVKYSHVKT